MNKVAPNSKFVGQFTEILWQSKIEGLLHYHRKCDHTTGFKWIIVTSQSYFKLGVMNTI